MNRNDTQPDETVQWGEELAEACEGAGEALKAYGEARGKLGELPWFRVRRLR